MDMKRKTSDIRNWEKHLFLNISSTNSDTLVTSLYQRVETRSIQVFCLFSATSTPPFQPLRHQRNVCHPVVNRFTRHTLPTVISKHFFMNILCFEPFAHKKKKETTELCSLVVHSSSTVAILTNATSL
jgi:hypothetical protein